MPVRNVLCPQQWGVVRFWCSRRLHLIGNGEICGWDSPVLHSYRHTCVCRSLFCSFFCLRGSVGSPSTSSVFPSPPIRRESRKLGVLDSCLRGNDGVFANLSTDWERGCPSPLVVLAFRGKSGTIEASLLANQMEWLSLHQ